MTFEARWHDASGRRHTENYDSAAEADRARQEHLRARRRGGSGDPTGGRVTLAAWHERWASTRLVAINTKARDELIWRNQIEPAFAGARLADLRRSAVAAWVAELARELAPATVVRSLAVLRKMLNDAVLEGLISTNPAASVALPKLERIERRFLSLDEIQRLQAAVEPWWSLVVPFAVTTGLRIGELAALTVGGLALASREVHVRATAVGVTRRVSGAEHRRQLQRPKTMAALGRIGTRAPSGPGTPTPRSRSASTATVEEGPRHLAGDASLEAADGRLRGRRRRHCRAARRRPAALRRRQPRWAPVA